MLRAIRLVLFWTCCALIAGFAIGIVVGLVFVGALSGFRLISTAAQAHSWYPADCCSDRDCEPLADDAVEEIVGGIRIKATGEIVAYDKAKVSQDGHYHICRYPGGGLICLFRPLKGV